jgi:enoyl-CoA hydratase
MTDAPHPDIRLTVTGRVGHIELTRPKALNALSLDMIRAVDPPLTAAIANPDVAMILITAEGERAFCAGGDVRAVALSLKDPASTMGRDFFFEEYRLNHRIHHCPKPFVALIDGISMGGGIGLSIHGSHRVVTEHVVSAMPETGIGLFPDIGATWFLSRAPGAVGLYLALTGARLGPADCGYIGYATHHVPRAEMSALAAALLTEAPADRASVDRVIARFAQPFGPAPLAERQATIDRCFVGDSVGEVLARLERDPDPWAAEVLAGLQAKSPLSLALSFEQLRRGAHLSLDQALVMEFRMAQACMAGHDFAEGIRALLIDKDNQPRWHPARLEDVTPDLVERHFAPVAAGELTFD